MTARVSGIRQIAVTVSDVEQALEFYRDLLGLEFLFAPNADLAFVQAGDVRIMLSTPQGAGSVGANSILYFQIEDIEAAFGDFVARGAREERAPALAAQMPDHELWVGFLRDPDGNLVGVLEEKR
ncbi:MAG TPA: VOC family protein [Gammaproteobacteria bacterium]|nr:VOC family protein [Gammaproteobacteria bacterium]